MQDDEYIKLKLIACQCVSPLRTVTHTHRVDSESDSHLLIIVVRAPCSGYWLSLTNCIIPHTEITRQQAESFGPQHLVIPIVYG